MTAPPLSRGTLLGVYAGLLVLLGLTAGLARLPAAAWSLPATLGIAIAKLLLIFWYFMQLRSQRALVRLFAVTGFFWLAIGLTLTFSDYLTRR